MAELMGDPRDPDAPDGAPTAADDAPALVPEAAWASMTVEAYVTFWSLSLYDVHVPQPLSGR